MFVSVVGGLVGAFIAGPLGAAFGFTGGIGVGFNNFDFLSIQFIQNYFSFEHSTKINNFHNQNFAFEKRNFEF